MNTVHSNNIFNYVSGIPSSGKTYNMVRDAADVAANGTNVLIVQPTLDLNRQTRRELAEAGGFALITVTQDAPQGAVAELRERILDRSLPDPQIVISTHAAFERLGLVANADKWRLYVDEEMEALAFSSFNVRSTHDLLTEHLVHHPVDELESVLSPSRPSAYEAFRCEVRTDTLLKPLETLTERLGSRVHTTFVSTEQYTRLIDPSGDEGALVAASVLSPEIFIQFESVVFLAADFEDTIFYKLMRQHAEFEPYLPIQSRLRMGRSSFPEVTLKYLMADRQWSMRFRRDIFKKATTIACEAILKDIRSERLAFVDNEEFKARFHLRGHSEMPFNPHGLNQFSGIHNVASLTSILPAPAHHEFLLRRALTEEDIFIGFTAMPAWQALCRGSLRNPNNRDAKKLYVGEKRIAEWIATKLPGCTVELLPTTIPQTVSKGGRKKMHASPADRVRAYRARKKEAIARRESPEIVSPCNESHYSNIGNVTLSSYPDLQAKLALSQVTCESHGDLFDLLEQMHTRKIESKDDNVLISTTVFEQKEGSTTTRAKYNIVHVSGIWLDNDGGSLNHKSFAALLPRVQMVCFNSFSHSKECERYRVYIPTTHAMSSGEYEQVFDSIIARVVQDHGADHGFDRSKRPATSFFYAPCQAKNPDDSFFYKALDEPRAPLNPENWLSNRPIMLPPKTNIRRQSRDRDVDLSAVLARYGDEIVIPGKGNEAFKNLATSLYGKGLDEVHMRQVLHMEAYRAAHPEQRLAEVERLIKWCQQTLQ